MKTRLNFSIIALLAFFFNQADSFARSDQTCASLYSVLNFQGDSFNVTDGVYFSNLEEEYVTTDSVWNVTTSVKVESGCMFTACNESYFDGKCQEFDKEFVSLPPGFDNILSVNCTCAKNCKCEDFYNMRKNSCARAYLFEGGCNSCNPYYTDLKGEEESFPEEFENKVTSIMVREGCQLTIHDELGFGGESVTVEGIQQDWKMKVGSYECVCIAEPPKRPPPPRNPEYPPWIEVPSTLDAINAMMNGENERHPGLTAALQSMSKKRSPRNAYILLLGSTGAGKSSAINLLFDNPNVTRVGAEKSTTKDIHEFRIPIPVDELGIQNSELRVIDTPGLGDTKGLDQDAKFLATLEEFLDGHEELSTRMPNVILVFHKFTDNRFAGEGSAFVKMIRGLDEFRPRITDKKYSNVIFVFSHFTGEINPVIRNPKKKLAALKKVIEEYSQFPRPIVIAAAENKASEQNLPMVNGYYKLPNGDYYPRNLFDRITQITSGGQDVIGEAIIRTAFRDPDDFNVTASDFTLVDPKNSRVPKFLGILSGAVYNVEQTEVSQMLATAYETLDPQLKQRFPDGLYYLQKALNIRNIRTAADIPRTTTGIVQLLTDLKQNDAVLELLHKAFDISPPVLKENVLTGYSYNVFKDIPLAVSPFNLGALTNSDIGYKFPSMITCVVDTQAKDVLHFFGSRKEYMEERMKGLNIGGRMSLDSFTGVTKAGYNVVSEITSPEGQQILPITAVRELRKFELVLNDRFTLTPEFKKIVRTLTPYNESNHESVDQWKTFFNEYGTHVVKSVYGGGAIEIELSSDKPFSMDITRTLLSFIQFAEDISLGKVGNSSFASEGTQHSLKFNGGDKAYHTSDLTKMSLQDASNLLENWKDSLSLSPTILTTEMRLLPISEIVKREGQNISSEIERASGLLFNSTLKYVPPPKPSTLLPGEDRGNTAHMQTGSMLSSFMEKMMEESRKSDERFQKMMERMQDTQRRAEEKREEREKEQREWQREERRLEIQRQNDERDHQLKRDELQANINRDQLNDQRAKDAIRRQEEKTHSENLQSLQRQQQNDMMKAMIAIANQPIPSNDGGCLKKGTNILMADKSEMPVELLELGDIILDHNLRPTRVAGVLQKFLGEDDFYGFDNETYFFTDSHLLVGSTPIGSVQLYVHDLDRLIEENPLMLYLGIKAISSETKMLRFSRETWNVAAERVTLFKEPKKFPKDELVYIILVDSEDGTYIANGYVCRHEIPPIKYWPKTMSLLFSLVSLPEIKWIEKVPYTLENLRQIEEIVNESVRVARDIIMNHKDRAVHLTRKTTISRDETLPEKVILEIFDNPTFSSLAVGLYGKLGPLLAVNLDLGQEHSEIKNIQMLRSQLHEELRVFLSTKLQRTFMQ